jgi:hypothetical protein
VLNTESNCHVDRDPAHQTEAKIRAKQNRSFSAAVTGKAPSRARRNTDWLFASLDNYTRAFQGLLVEPPWR